MFIYQQLGFVIDLQSTMDWIRVWGLGCRNGIEPEAASASSEIAKVKWISCRYIRNVIV